MNKTFLLALVVLAGCQAVPVVEPVRSVPPPRPMMAPPPPPLPAYRTEERRVTSVSIPDAASTGSSYKMPYREFLSSSDYGLLNKDKIASFVLFTHRPITDDDKAKFQRVCNYWEANFERATDLDVITVENEMVPLYWPSYSKEGSECKDLHNYNYALSSKIVARVGKEATSSSGPLLVLNKGKEWLVLDISRFATEDTERAFSVWKTQICRNDPLSGLKLTKFKEYFRALVQIYGSSVLKVLEKGNV